MGAAWQESGQGKGFGGKVTVSVLGTQSWVGGVVLRELKAGEGKGVRRAGGVQIRFQSPQ